VGVVGLPPAFGLEVAVAYREVHVVEVKELLRQWMLGRKLRGIARSLGVDRKTVRRYVEAAEEAGGRTPELQCQVRRSRRFMLGCG
jgi:hypothetical protein